jgi:hypothetical protein
VLALQLKICFGFSSSLHADLSLTVFSSESFYLCNDCAVKMISER